MKGLGLFAGFGIFFLLLILALFILPLVFWILKVVKLFKNKSKTGAWVVLLVGIFFTPLIGLLVGLAFKEDEKTESEDYFWCGLCHTKYQAEFLGGETAHEGKICRSCLGKRQRGETFPPPPNQNYQPKEEVYYKPFKPEREFDTTKNQERNRLLLRELGRKQRKKNGYLTQFIINLAVLQWLLPLLTIIFFWVGLKDQMKVEAMNNPSLGLATEIPFGTVFKNIFKMLTSEYYDYGGHRILINTGWKVGIILALLLPLGFWIYNLVRFLGTNGEIKQLETEVKGIR